MMPKILLVEDEKDIREYLQQILTEQDFFVQAVGDGISAINLAQKMVPDLVLLDLGLPTISGEDVCRQLKKLFPAMPIIIVTAKDTTQDIVQGLSFGSDDYITKPFNVDELIARIRTRLRQTPTEKLQIGDLELDEHKFQAKRSNKIIQLTPHEFQLLKYLLLNKKRVLTREMILNRVWKFTQDVDTRVVDVYMGYLRKKIDKNFSKKLIQSLRGFGYMISDE